jgi:hypothetical protein
MDMEQRKQQILDWISIPVNRQVLAGLSFGAALLTFDPVVIAAILATEGYLIHKGVLTNDLK